MKYTVIYEKGDSGWGAYVPDLHGLRSEGLPVPPPASWAGTLDIVAA